MASPAASLDLTNDVSAYMSTLGRQARSAATRLARATTAEKNAALEAIAGAIMSGAEALKAQNEKDLDAGRQRGIEQPLLDRLELTDARIASMAEGLRQIAALPDPIGELTDLKKRPTGIEVGRMRVPLGVIGIIYESRPNVTADAAGLCLKSGNATILRGGSEAIHSNRAIAACLQRGLQEADLPGEAVQVVQVTDRAAVGALITMPEFVDVIVPRGGKSLIERISREATIPVIKHLDGVCHVYIDDRADLVKAASIAFNAKCNRYAVCNAIETLLVAESVAADVLPGLAEQYRAEGVELRGCDRTRAIVTGAVPASEQDWVEEYLAPILAVKVVDDLDAAMDHIREYGSQHTDAIVTEDWSRARRFMTEVDSSSVMINASPRFADGFEYGLGAEIGISTDKLHARGPVGLEGLTSQKYVVFGDGHIRQ